MSGLAANLLLALAWAILTGDFAPANLVVGFLLGYLALLVAEHGNPTGGYGRRLARTLRFGAFYVREMLLSNLRVARDILTLRHHARPAVIAVPLEARSDAQITMLANLVTMTPGSMTLDVSPDRRWLYVHVMFADDVEQARREVLDLERRVLEVLR